jgi:chemotaxis protein MotB
MQTGINAMLFAASGQKPPAALKSLKVLRDDSTSLVAVSAEEPQATAGEPPPPPLSRDIGTQTLMIAKQTGDYSLVSAYMGVWGVQTINGTCIANSAGQSALDNLQQQLTQSQAETDEQKRLRAESELQIEMLNAQLLLLRQQLARLVTALDASEAKAKADDVQIVDLGKRLNEALANKVEELARYRSEFFGKLREVLGNRPDIQIVGDRFIFQSEVLFDTRSAEIGDEGKHQLAAFADTLKNIAARIPPDIDWILRVDGHTDKRPYQAGNWELSTERAIAVVRFLIDQGIPPNRLVAAGFAEFRPLVQGDNDDAYRHNRRIELKLDQR